MQLEFKIWYLGMLLGLLGFFLMLGVLSGVGVAVAFIRSIISTIIISSLVIGMDVFWHQYLVSQNIVGNKLDVLVTDEDKFDKENASDEFKPFKPEQVENIEQMISNDPEGSADLLRRMGINQ